MILGSTNIVLVFSGPTIYEAAAHIGAAELGVKIKHLIMASFRSPVTL